VHITGGGFTDNIPRVLPKGLGCSIDKTAWEVPKHFTCMLVVPPPPPPRQSSASTECEPITHFQASLFTTAQVDGMVALCHVVSCNTH